VAPGVPITSTRLCDEDSIRFRFGKNLDLQTLERIVDVERDCCPFFRFAFDGAD
jgi:hypothetical protein